MSETRMKRIMAFAVGLTCEILTDDELIILATIAMTGSDPRNNKLLDYDMIKNLFTEQNGTQMHEETAAAVIDYAARRTDYDG